MQFSHRNGETTQPTELGYFWFRDYEAGADDDELHPIGIFFLMVGLAHTPTGETIAIDELRGRWWGPVTPPWEQRYGIIDMADLAPAWLGPGAERVIDAIEKALNSHEP